MTYLFQNESIKIGRQSFYLSFNFRFFIFSRTLNCKSKSGRKIKNDHEIKISVLGFELGRTERNWKISSKIRKFRRRWFCRLTARTEYVQLWSNTLHDQVDPTAISVQFKLNSPSSIDFYNFNNSFQFQWFFQTKLKFFQLHSIQFHVGLSNFTFFNFSFFQLPFTTTHIVFVISLSFSVWEWRFSEKNILVEWLCFF